VLDNIKRHENRQRNKTKKGCHVKQAYPPAHFHVVPFLNTPVNDIAQNIFHWHKTRYELNKQNDAGKLGNNRKYLNK
jgi:hypothetical protein